MPLDPITRRPWLSASEIVARASRQQRKGITMPDFETWNQEPAAHSLHSAPDSTNKEVMRRERRKQFRSNCVLTAVALVTVAVILIAIFAH